MRTSPETSEQNASHSGVSSHDLLKPHVETATSLIVDRGLVGFVWLNEELCVIRRSGALTDWIAVGQPYGVALPMLVGYEETLSQLRGAPESSTVLPNVGLQLGEADPPKSTCNSSGCPSRASI